MVCRIRPAKKDWMDASATKPQTIRVGKFGTIPVSAYVIHTGMKNPMASTIRIAATVPKNARGR